MTAHAGVQPARQLQLVVDAAGQPTAVLIDLATWRELLALLEDDADAAALGAASEDLQALARGERPPGWLPWAEVEAELNRLDEAGALPD